MAWRRSPDNTDAEVEYGIALFNGTGVPRTKRPPRSSSVKAARTAIRSPRTGSRGSSPTAAASPKNPVEATKWHLIAKARGETNLTLDDFVNKLDPATRAAGEKAAQPFIDALKEPKG